MHWAWNRHRGYDGEQTNMVLALMEVRETLDDTLLRQKSHCEKCYEGGAVKEGKGVCWDLLFAPEIHSPPAPHTLLCPWGS